MKRPVNLFRRLSLTQQVFALILLFLAFFAAFFFMFLSKNIDTFNDNTHIKDRLSWIRRFPETGLGRVVGKLDWVCLGASRIFRLGIRS